MKIFFYVIWKKDEYQVWVGEKSSLRSKRLNEFYFGIFIIEFCNLNLKSSNIVIKILHNDLRGPGGDKKSRKVFKVIESSSEPVDDHEN